MEIKHNASRGGEQARNDFQIDFTDWDQGNVDMRKMTRYTRTQLDILQQKPMWFY